MRTRAPARRPLRADARRNRAHVLEIARAVFAAEGTGVAMDELARRAGVGVGTLYRQFPTKEAMLAAIISERIASTAAHAREFAHAPEPGAAFFAFLRRMWSDGMEKRDLFEALSGSGIDVRATVAGPAKTLRGALATLLRRAQSAGAVRAGLGVEDVLSLFAGVSLATRRGGTPARMLDVLIDGLRARSEER
jgi:AcrR family transcriptional regulator